MKQSDIPTRFNIPFANAAGGGFTRPIPEASQVGITDGAASLTTGFPPLNFLALDSGGVPPSGQDFNGILNQISAWSRFQSAGAPAKWNGTWSAAVGGYPQGSQVLKTGGSGYWVSLVDDNVTNPDASGAGWIDLALLVGGSGSLVNTGAGGYWKFPSGLVLQWGTIGSSHAKPCPVVLPFVLSVGVFVAIATDAGNGDGLAIPLGILSGSYSTTGFTVISGSNVAFGAFRWIAVGI